MHGWEIGLTPVTVPMVNHETACLGALVVAAQPGLLVGYVDALGCRSVGLKHASLVATLTIAKYADLYDPVLGHKLSITCL